MATHINNICERDYVVIVGGRKLEPTKLGLALFDGYQAVDEDLVSPKLRSRIEKSCSEIAQGLKKFEDVVTEMTALFKTKFVDFRQNIGKMDKFFGQVFTTVDHAKENAKLWTSCGKCHRYMDMLKEYNKMICTTCEKEYRLPPNAKYYKVGNNRCPVDGFQLFKYSYNGNNLNINLLRH